ncbi:MAG TPA: enoyl-CoA hydratase/isomerase family protein [Galbitalea sp.]|nr:enoyl-CoA hydratase/isomerase family protein [Galbitalea sp.]
MTATKSGGRITVSIADGVASVLIDNPGRKNAATKAMCQALQALMPRLDDDPDVVVVTLRGAGDTFSAGASLDNLTSVLLDRQDDGSVVDHLSLADAAITHMRKPTIALVDGACMGGGWQLASACDFVVASDRSSFAITPAKIGVIYPRVGIERLVRLVGPANAKFILFSGETFTALRAQQLGLITETVTTSEFESRAHELVRTVLARSQFSIHTLKNLIGAGNAVELETNQLWNDAWSAMTLSPDMAIGVNAFLNREQPIFAWKPPRN